MSGNILIPSAVCALLVAVGAVWILHRPTHAPALDACTTGVDLERKAAEAYRRAALYTAGGLYAEATRILRRLDFSADPPLEHPLMAVHQSSTNTFRFVNRVKLRHDAEQLELLLRRKKLPQQPYKDIARMHRQLLQTLPAANTPKRTDMLHLNPLQGPKLFRRAFNRAVHVPKLPRVSQPTLNMSLDWKAIAKEYYKSKIPEDAACVAQNGLAVVDNVLSEQTLAALRQWCEEATIWYDSRPGFLGSFFESSFNEPLLFQVAEELRTVLPDILGRHPLIDMWAFKYSNDESDWPPAGIGLHADVAAVNFNLWISKEGANIEEGSGGGLTIYMKGPPSHWGFGEYNGQKLSQQKVVADLLKGAKYVNVTHKPNRMVIFNSNFFHESQVPRFKTGYENRRINLTFLYGHRCQKKLVTATNSNGKLV